MNLLHFKTILAIPVLGLFLSSCGDWDYNLRRELKSFEKETITFPERVMQVENGTYEIIPLRTKGKTLVLFFAPGECTSCALSHLKPAESLFDISKQYPSFNVVVLFVPIEGETKNLVDQIKQLGYNFPIYVDYERQFLENSIPDDNRFHTFLLDEDGHPIVVGNPLYSESIRELILEQVH